MPDELLSAGCAPTCPQRETRVSPRSVSCACCTPGPVDARHRLRSRWAVTSPWTSGSRRRWSVAAEAAQICRPRGMG